MKMCRGRVRRSLALALLVLSVAASSFACGSQLVPSTPASPTPASCTLSLSLDQTLHAGYGGYYDLDLTVPAGTPAADYVIWFWATDAQGRTSELKSATLTVIVR